MFRMTIASLRRARHPDRRRSRGAASPAADPQGGRPTHRHAGAHGWNCRRLVGCRRLAHDRRRETKIALLGALRLPASSHAQALESLHRIVEEREARLVPHALVGRIDDPLAAPLRSDAAAPPRQIDLRIETEDGRRIELRAGEQHAHRRILSDGREINERLIALPELPIGRHRLFADEVACELTIAPRTAYLPEGARRQRFAFSAQLYAQRRESAGATSDQGIGDFTTLGLLGQAAGRVGAAALGVNPLHVLFAGIASARAPIIPRTGRFLDAIHIDALDGADLPSDGALEMMIAASAGAVAKASSAPSSNMNPSGASRKKLLKARWAAFERARIAQPHDPLFSQYAAFVGEGGETLRRFAIFQAIGQESPGDWRGWPDELRRADPAALNEKASEYSQGVAFALFTQWLADRQLAGAAARAKVGGLEFGLYRDLAVGAAPDGAEAWARADELAEGASVGAPPDPFSANGQIWHVPPPDRWPERVMAGAGCRRSTRLTCAMPACCASTMQWAWRDCSSSLTGPSPPKAPISLIARRAARPYRAGKPAPRLHGRRRGPWHGPGGISRDCGEGGRIEHARCCGSSAATANSSRRNIIPRSPSPAPPPMICRLWRDGGKAPTLARE